MPCDGGVDIELREQCLRSFISTCYAQPGASLHLPLSSWNHWFSLAMPAIPPAFRFYTFPEILPIMLCLSVLVFVDLLCRLYALAIGACPSRVAMLSPH
ncbi:hypothetical protein CYLTODRAFT_268998 [Cylindrobasidium torrendii FP15055 ss-10]|uniref:Uncharacterized protein n=1 Tax=Cylindrobasidium torrendii FP15055 ss-10 TaxID=1314674 RepID=A0A0D7BR52_9AGAR|nr:hypothetical protein CYLTODRAFT_268998 [Cylindrobasidium torrendii FP15055 ss-10]